MENISALPSADILSPERRARILASAAQIFSRDGYKGASMANIAAAANVSKGTLYNYFKNKQALFTAFVRDGCERLVQQVFGDPLQDAPVAEELARIGGTMLRTTIAPRGQAVFRVVVMEAEEFPDLSLAFMQAGPMVMVERMAKWLAAQHENGVLFVPDPVFAAEQFFSLTQTRVVLRARMLPAFKATESEINHVIEGAVRVFLAAYGSKTT